jgi:outer membrane protein TolC
MKIKFFYSCMFFIMIINNQFSQTQNLFNLWEDCKVKNLLPQQLKNTAEQHRILAKGARQHPSLTAYLNHEAFKFSDFNNGMYSIYAQQNFNLPQVANAYREWQNNLAKNSELDALIVQNELKLTLFTHYADFVEAKMWVNQLNNWDLIYSQWEKIAQAQYNAGATSKLPVLQSQAQRELLKLQINQKQQQVAIYKNQLIYICRTTELNITDSLLLDLGIYFDSSYLKNLNVDSLPNHLLAQQAFQQIQTNQAKQKNIESQLIPQLYTQVQMQILDKQAPFWGAAIGVSVPIFPQNIKAQSAQIEQQSRGLKLNLEWNLQTIGNHLTVAQQEITRLFTAIQTYQKTVLPLYEQQLAMSLKFYQNGESDYLYFLQATQQLFTQQSNYWTLQREYIQHRILWDYYLATP